MRPGHCHRQSRQSCSPPVGSPAIVIIIITLIIMILVVMLMKMVMMMVVMKGSFDSYLKFKKSSLPDTTNNTKWSKYSTQSKLKLNVSEGENLY